jgi:putative solute:sodium symporter small subunit
MIRCESKLGRPLFGQNIGLSRLNLDAIGCLMGGVMAAELSERHHEYWRKNVRMTLILLGIWAFVTFVIGYYARDLSFSFFGWPFSFYMGAQGSLIIYVLIIWFYASYMGKLDKEYGVAEDEEE